jgi:hypothetical protein
MDATSPELRPMPLSGNKADFSLNPSFSRYLPELFLMSCFDFPTILNTEDEHGKQ